MWARRDVFAAPLLAGLLSEAAANACKPVSPVEEAEAIVGAFAKHVMSENFKAAAELLAENFRFLSIYDFGGREAEEFLDKGRFLEMAKVRFAKINMAISGAEAVTSGRSRIVQREFVRYNDDRNYPCGHLHNYLDYVAIYDVGGPTGKGGGVMPALPSPPNATAEQIARHAEYDARRQIETEKRRLFGGARITSLVYVEVP
jgi:hypothetical protein